MGFTLLFSRIPNFVKVIKVKSAVAFWGESFQQQQQQVTESIFTQIFAFFVQ